MFVGVIAVYVGNERPQHFIDHLIKDVLLSNIKVIFIYNKLKTCL